MFIEKNGLYCYLSLLSSDFNDFEKSRFLLSLTVKFLLGTSEIVMGTSKGEDEQVQEGETEEELKKDETSGPLPTHQYSRVSMKYCAPHVH